MPHPPAQVVQWLKRTYPRPTIDPEWLEGCYTWIVDELHLDPARDMPAILENVNNQLLESDFNDSMLAGTGFPRDAIGAADTVLQGPILVEVVEIMEIGHSAFSLMQTYESRVEYRKQAELRTASGDRDDGERKPLPKYPRSMLQFQLSDGMNVLPAIEVKNMPEFELGETPLGYKILIKDVPIRRGTAHLQPNCVELKGHQTADRDEGRETKFLRALKRRLGGPVEGEPEAAAAPALAPAPLDAHAPAAPAPVRQATPPRPHGAAPAAASHSPRSPLCEIPAPRAVVVDPSGSPHRRDEDPEHVDDANMPRRRKQPSRTARSPSRDPPPREAVLQRSRYFTKPSGSTNGAGTDANDTNNAGGNTGRVRVDSGDVHAMQDLARAIGLSPPRAPPSTAEDEEEGEENPFAPDAKGKQKAAPAFGEQNSDYDFEFDVDDSFLEQVARAEQEALRAGGPSAPTAAAATSDHTQTLVQAQAQVKAESQSESKSLFSMATSATAVGTQRSAGRGRRASCTPAPGSRAPSAPGTSSSGAGMDMDVIDISDDEVEDDKENVPVRARHVRARYDVIELSD